jgi:hypothetical protein
MNKKYNENNKKNMSQLRLTHLHNDLGNTIKITY